MKNISKNFNMKTKLFSLCILLALSLPIQSQTTYDYLSRPGLTIASEHHNFFKGTRNNTYQFIGDTLLCGENLLIYQPLFPFHVETFLRIDGGKVWRKDYYPCDNEWLIYDFDLEVGDTFNSYEVIDTDTITLLNGEDRKRLFLTKNGIGMVEWVDGIGDLAWGLFPIADFEGYTSLVCVKENDETIWLSPDQSAELCDSISCPVPYPDFDFDVESFQVNFENQSVNHTSLLWDFGDGETSTELHPNHTYQNPGCYNVTLTLGTDCLDSKFKQQLSVPVCIAQEWQVNSPNLTTGSFEVDFITESVGWAISINQIWKTEDSGMSWTEQFYPIPPPSINRQLVTIDMANEMNGVIALANYSAPTSIAAFLITNDGGLTWEEKIPGSYFASSAMMTDDGQVFAATTYNGVFYSSDWGDSFVELSVNGIDLSTFKYLGNNKVVAMGLEGLPPFNAVRTISFSDNSGQSWTQNFLPDAYYRASGFHFFNLNEGFLCGGLHEGFIIKTEDGGQSWQEIPYNDERRPTRIHFVDEQTGWVVGKDGLVLSTTDGGNTWLTENCGYRNNLVSISALDSENCWLGSGHGKYLELNPDAVDCSMVNVNHPNMGDDELMIFPNPASESVTISLPESDVNENNRIVIYNNLGQNIFEGSILNETLSINTTAWNSGIYFVQWYRNEQFIGIEKLIVLD